MTYESLRFQKDLQSDGVARRDGFLMALIDKTHVANMPQHVGSTGQHVASSPLLHQPVMILSPGESPCLCTLSSFLCSRSRSPYFSLFTSSLYVEAPTPTDVQLFSSSFFDCSRKKKAKKKKRLETSPGPLGHGGRKCLQGCLRWSLFCSTVGKEGRDLVDPQTL